MCAGWKWLDDKDITCRSIADYPEYDVSSNSDDKLVRNLWDLLDQADIVVAHNGDSFDVKHINTRFVYHGLRPPSPYRTIDTLKVAKKYFKFGSNSLDNLGKYLDAGRKSSTGGFSLWLDCLAGKKEAWEKMKRYNIQDIALLEKIYLRMRPFISNHPDVAGSPEHKCRACSSSDIEKRGFSHTLTGSKQRYQCRACGSWSSGPSRRRVSDDDVD